MKKIIIFLIISCLLCLPLNAQKKVEKQIDFTNKESLKMNIQIADSIRIITWNKNKAFISASININDNKDNENYEISFEENGPVVKVTSNFNSNNSDKNHKGKRHCDETNIYFEVYIPENINLSIETIDGSIIISGKTASISAHSISGFIDLTLSPDQKADLNFKTISGTIYSNMELASAGHKGFLPVVDSQINGGGNLIELKTISGDIYFRKADK